MIQLIAGIKMVDTSFGYLLTNKINSLGKSKGIALRQFYATERKMARNEEFEESYQKFIKECVELGHLHKVKEAVEEGYYTLHHGVVTSQKFRVVLNASCKTTTGISLHETQFVAAKLQNDLANILMEFRNFEIALTADIAKMFRQIDVIKEDQKYQKILWRYSEQEPVDVYQFNSALDNSKEFPLGAKAVLAFYVDDALTGADSIKEAQVLKTQMINLLSRGQFEPSKWASNCNSLSNNESPEFLEDALAAKRR